MTRTEKKMKLKGYGLLCSVNGCYNTDAYFVSLNGVVGGNTPNICKECAKLIYEAMYPEAVKESVQGESEENAEESDEKTEETEDDASASEENSKRTRKRA